jgi:hypothetical protein
MIFSFNWLCLIGKESSLIAKAITTYSGAAFLGSTFLIAKLEQSFGHDLD